MTFDLQLSSELAAEQIVDEVLAKNTGSACLTCSFQAEDMIVLDLVRKRLPEIPMLSPGDWLSLRGDVRVPGSHREAVVAEPGECGPSQDCGGAGIRAGHFVSKRANAMLSAAQS